jgi:hypothetical protein
MPERPRIKEGTYGIHFTSLRKAIGNYVGKSIAVPWYYGCNFTLVVE